MESNQQRQRPPAQEPTVTEDKSSMGGTTHTHPAFAYIRASRVSGAAVLFGSDFEHQHYISIQIGPSTLRRTLSNDWHHGGIQRHIEVCLSEAQWAQFISSMNVGDGAPCTLMQMDGKDVPRLVRPKSRRAQFSAESDERMQRAMQSIAEAEEAVRASGLSQKKQAELLNKLRRASMDIGVNQKFVADQFAEHMEKTVTSAKIEVEGYISGAVRQAGLEALKGAGLIPNVEPIGLSFHPILNDKGSAA